MTHAPVSFSFLTEVDTTKDSTGLYPFWSCSSSLYLSHTLPSVSQHDPHNSPLQHPKPWQSSPPSSISSFLAQPPMMFSSVSDHQSQRKSACMYTTKIPWHCTILSMGPKVQWLSQPNIWLIYYSILLLFYIYYFFHSFAWDKSFFIKNMS